MEVLEALKNAGFLERLAFGGGTMLRLCHDMHRYSADLDFWLLSRAGWRAQHPRLRAFLRRRFELTDCHRKFFTWLYEVRTPGAPRRLKLEIRRMTTACDVEDKIAFSPHDTRQVLVKGLTLDQMMRNTVQALLDREEIRDAFDLEFLLRRGISLPASRRTLGEIARRLRRFTPRDYRVTLGSLLEPDARAYYRHRGFGYLEERLRVRSAEIGQRPHR